MPGRGQQPPTVYQRQSWVVRHKVLTALGSLAVLIIVIVGMASLGAKTRQADNASTVATTTPTRTATPIRTPAHHAVSTGTAPAEAPVTAQAAAPAPATTAPAPVATVHAASPTPPAATTSAACYPKTNAGNCYKPGEYCRDSDHDMTGVAGDREAIKCENVGGWRWEPA